MNVDIDRVIRISFSLKYELFYRLGLDGISARFCSSTLNQSLSVPYQYKINYRSLVLNLCITNIEAQMGIYLKEKD